MNRLLRLSIFLLILLGISGCASLFNPHLDFNRDTFLTGAPSMVEAIKYANDNIAIYRQGMGDQAKLSSWTGVVLIPLSAATVALGIQGGHTNAITNMAVGGAATYGISNWLSNPNRSLIYAEGISAMNCAKQAMLPYYVSDTWIKEFSNALTKLSIQGSILATQLAELHALTMTLEGLSDANDNQVKNMKALADDFNRLLAAAMVSRGNGFILQRRLELAGQTLVFAVDRIAGEVDKALLSTVPSLTALPGIIASLNPTADMFRQVPTPTSAAAKGKDTPMISAQSNIYSATTAARVTLMNKEQEVRNTVRIMVSAEAIVSAAVANFEQPISTAALKLCGVSEEDIVKPLRVIPSNQITMKAGDTKSVFLTGGSGQYAATATGEVMGLTVSQPIPLGEAIRIATTNKTPAAKTSILVKDIAGQIAIIELTIMDVNKKDANGGKEDDGTTFSTFEKNLGLNDIQQIQTALRICNKGSELKIDGKIGNDTRDAAKKCAKVASKVFDEGKVKSLKDEFLVDGLPKAGVQTPFEGRATISDLKDVYKMVGILTLPVSQVSADWFTKDFRTKLREFQQNHDNTAQISEKIGISGLYTKDFPEPE